jgi:hypothetical protein
MSNSNNFASLDFLRAISAFLVAWGHSRFLMLVPSAEVNDITIIDKIIYFLAGFGPQAVIVFFVLSGFFITRSIENRLSKNTFSLKDYFIDRYFRLSVVAIPAIVLTFVLDQFAFNFFHKDLLYLQRCEDWLDSSSYTLQTFFGNIFYLQTLFYNSFGSNGPLWSLAYEWWFYVLAPFVSLPAPEIINFQTFVDEDWIIKNTNIDTTKPITMQGMNNEIFIYDENKNEQYSLQELSKKTSEEDEEITKDTFRHIEIFENAYIDYNNVKLKLKKFLFDYIRQNPIESNIEIDITKELIGVIEYINQNKKTAVFKDRIIKDW